MAKKGLDEDRLKFFKGMGGAETSESDKTESENKVGLYQSQINLSRIK